MLEMTEYQERGATSPSTGLAAVESEIFFPSVQKDAHEALSKLQEEALSWLPRIPEKISQLAEKAALKLSDAVKSAAAKGPEKTEWTIVVDLTTNFYAGNGVTNRLKELNELAKQTEGKSITFVVQAQVPIEGDPLDPEFASWDYDYTIDRYVIQNGKVTKLESDYSQGYGQDLEGLLALTCKRFAPEKLGLILDSHGDGNQGLQGDARMDLFSTGGNIGELKIDDLTKSIKRGLRDSGRKKIDLIDFDCCLMGQNGVIQRLNGLADHVVASPETENIIGQNLRKPLERLIANTKLSPAEFAEDIVSACKQQKPRDGGWLWKKPVPVETLSHYDVKFAQAFNTSLNSFGDAMTAAVKDPKNAKAVEDIIDKTYTYGGKRRQISIFGVFLAEESHGRKFDIKEFTQRVVSAIEKKELNDPSGQIKKSANEVLANHSKLVRSYFGYGLYEKQGGLSVFLPGRHLRDPDFAAKTKTTVFQLHKLGNEVTEGNTQEQYAVIKKKLKDVGSEIESASKDKTELKMLEQVKQKYQKVEKSFKSLESGPAQDFAKNLSRFQKATEELSRCTFYEGVLQKARDRARNETADQYKAELVTSDNGWGRFRRAMQRD